MFSEPMWTGIMFDLSRYRVSEPHITNDQCTHANTFVEKILGHMKWTF